MPYLVEHVRYTLLCDCCGRVEKRDLDASQETQGTHGWSEIRTPWRSYICCPTCQDSVQAILDKKEREEKAAQALNEETCAHDYRRSGFAMRCRICQRCQ